MSNNLLFSALLLFSLVFITACEPEFIPAANSEIEMDFFPIDTYTTWEYQLDSVIYDNEGLSVDTTLSYLREQVKGSFMDVEGNITYRLSIAKKKELNDIYTETDLWTFKLNETGFQRTEENLNFVKLLFPIVVGDFWDGNQFPEDTEVYVSGDAIEVYRGWEYEYFDRFESYTLGSEIYKDVLHVKQADNKNEVRTRFSEEFYAKGVGLIAKNMVIYDSQPGTLPLQGFTLTQRLIDFY